jgi:hypothetical protein
MYAVNRFRSFYQVRLGLGPKIIKILAGNRDSKELRWEALGSDLANSMTAVSNNACSKLVKNCKQCGWGDAISLIGTFGYS